MELSHEQYSEPVEVGPGPQLPERSGSLALIASAIGIAARTGFYIGRATEKTTNIARKTHEELKGILANAGTDAPEAETNTSSQPFSRELGMRTAKAAAITAGSTLLLGLANRIDSQPKKPSRKLRAAAWAIRAAGSSMG